MPELSVLLKTKDQTTPEFKKVDQAATKLTRDMKKYGVEGKHALDIVEKEFKQMALEAQQAGVKGTAGMKRLKDEIDRLKNASNKLEPPKSERWQAFTVAAGVAIGNLISRLADLGVQAVKTGLELSMEAWKEVDAGMDKIRVSTGLTGDALKAMQKQVEDAFTSMPITMDSAAAAYSRYNQIAGSTGDVLDSQARQTLELATILGTEVTPIVESSAHMWNAWKITTDDQGESMDLMLRMYQETGIAVTDLMAKTAEAAPKMREYGFTFEQTAGIIAMTAKSGQDAGKYIDILGVSWKALAKEGKDPQAELIKFSETIKNHGRESKEGQAAMKDFGRGGAELALALEKGTLDVEAFLGTVGETGDTVHKAFQDIQDPIDVATVSFNRFRVAAAPIGGTIFESLALALEQNQPAIISGINAIADSIAFLTGTYKQSGVEQQGFWESLKGTIKEIPRSIASGDDLSIALFTGPIGVAATAGKEIGAKISSGILVGLGADKAEVDQAIANTFSVDAYIDAFKSIPTAFDNIIDYFSQGYLGEILAIEVENIKASFGNLWRAFGEGFQGTLDEIAASFMDLWRGITTGNNKFLNGIENGINSALNFIEGAFDSAIGAITGTLEEIGISFDLGDYAEAFDGMVSYAGEKWAELQTYASDAWQAVQDTVSDAISSMGTIYDQLKTDMKAAWESLKTSILSIAKSMWTAIKNTFTTALSELATTAWAKVKQLASPFTWLYEKLEKRSTIPDMWRDIKITWNEGLDSITNMIRASIPEIVSEFDNMTNGVNSSFPDLPFMAKPDKARGNEKPEAAKRREENEARGDAYKQYQDREKAIEWFRDQERELDIASKAEGAARDKRAQEFEYAEQQAHFAEMLASVQTDQAYYLEHKASFDQIQQAMTRENTAILAQIADEGARDAIDRQWGLVQEKLTIEQYYDDAMTQAADRRLQEAMDYADAGARLAKAKGKTELGIAMQFGGAALNELSSTSKDMFELNKNAGIANAIINAYVGISKTISEYPFPLNVAMAAAQAALAFAQVQNIASQHFEGGSSSGGGGGGGYSGGGGFAGGGGGVPGAGTEAARMGAFNSTIDFRRLNGKMIVGDAADIYQSFWDQLDDRFKRNATFTYM